MNKYEQIIGMSPKKLASFLRDVSNGDCACCTQEENSTCNNMCFESTLEYLKREV